MKLEPVTQPEEWPTRIEYRFGEGNQLLVMAYLFGQHRVALFDRLGCSIGTQFCTYRDEAAKEVVKKLVAGLETLPESANLGEIAEITFGVAESYGSTRYKTEYRCRLDNPDGER